MLKKNAEVLVRKYFAVIEPFLVIAVKHRSNLMPTRLINRISLNVAVVILLSLVISPVGAGQATPDNISDPKSEKTTEEIVVYGKTSVIILQNAFYRAEESFFDMFNSLNSDDLFDVDCAKRQKSIAERRKEHRCMPNFALQYAGQASAGFARDMHYAMPKGGAISSFGDLDYQARVRAMEKKMWAEVVELAKSNPEFREEIKALQRAKLALDAERERRVGAK